MLPQQQVPDNVKMYFTLPFLNPGLFGQKNEGGLVASLPTQSTFQSIFSYY